MLQLYADDGQCSFCEAAVAVLGCGSLGGQAARCLAGAGVSRLILADRDRLSADNVRRHVCSLGDVGRAKADCVAEHLRRRYPDMRIDAQAFCFLEDPDRLRDILQAAAISLVAVDSEGPKHLINDIAWELTKPVVYAGVYGGGWGAEVVWTDPRRPTPCYACAARGLGRVGVEFFPPALPAYSAPVSAANGSRDAWVSADLRSILPIAALAADIVVEWLSARSAMTTNSDVGVVRLLGGRASAWRFGLGRRGRLDLAPWSLQAVPVTRFESCPVCGDPQRPATCGALPPRLSRSHGKAAA